MGYIAPFSEKRWGGTFIDRRNWKIYNEQLVVRGKFLLDLHFVLNWNSELKQMNLNKEGAPYKFPKSFIDLQSVWHAIGIPYRSIEGISRKLCDLGGIPYYNDYSTSNRRVNMSDFKLEVPDSKKLILFSDATGLQVIESGEYLREKYGKKNRRWVQVTILGDPDSKEPASFEVKLVQESELVSAKKQLGELLNDDIKVYQFGGDGSYDEIELWNWLESKGIEPCIKPDKNAVCPSESRIRDLNVKERAAVGYSVWSREHGYGYRWPATEGIFSAVKRIFGEKIHSRSELGILQEAKIKFWAYQKMKRYGEA
jgi:hypothetical protein